MENNYLETLVAQIREKRARESVRKEVEGHIREQKAHYMQEGMSEDEAEQKAVADMGDPIEAGIALDQIHKPKPAWGMLAAIAVLCAVGILLQYAAFASRTDSQMGDYYFKNQCLYAVIGFFILCGIYLIDYTRIASCSRFLCTGILLFIILAKIGIPFLHSQGTYAQLYSLPFFGHLISAEILFYLYLPFYGAVLYSYQHCSKQNVWKPLLYTILPLCLAHSFVHTSTFINLLAVLSVMFGTAIAKGWFFYRTKKVQPKAAKRILKAVCLFFAALAILYILLFSLQVYQTQRIQAWLHPFAYENSAGYIGSQIRTILDASQLIGSHNVQTAMDFLPNLEMDFILTYFIGKFGILPAALLIILISMLGIRLVQIAMFQKNQLGMMMGLGCSLTFLIQAVEYILVNLSVLPTSSLYFPLVSFGGSGMLQTCILLGILLSIYRYENVVSEPKTAWIEAN